METKNLIKTETGLLAMPKDLLQYCLSEVKSASPYNRYASGSFYTKEGKTWGHTPEGTIRISDHWNFYSRGDKHCITDVEDSKIAGKWVTAKYNSLTGVYEVISVDEKDFTALTKQEQRRSNKNYTDDLITRREKRVIRANAIRNKIAADKRAAKIKAKKLWIEININVWSGSGRKVRFAGTKTLIGLLTWESKTGKSFIIKTECGIYQEIRKTNSYKELKRKPTIKK